MGKRNQQSLTERIISAAHPERVTIVTDEFLEQYYATPTPRISYNVGDIHSDEKGSGARANGGKTQFHLVPLPLLKGVAQVFEYGMAKYSEWNWAKGMSWSIPYDCAERHLSAFFFEKEELDGESGLHHIDHAICNLLMLKHYLTYYKEGDNRPEYFDANPK